MHRFLVIDTWLKKSLENLIKKLEKSNQMDLYNEGILKLVEKEDAEPVPINEIKNDDGSVWYLPHHAVYNAYINRFRFKYKFRYK